jgi:hypothetical protein
VELASEIHSLDDPQRLQKSVSSVVPPFFLARLFPLPSLSDISFLVGLGRQSFPLVFALLWFKPAGLSLA